MMDLFELADEMDRMFRRPDHETSIAAARSVLPCRSELQSMILAALVMRGAMTDGELESMPAFKIYAPSTVRKRRSELFQAGQVAPTGEVRKRMKVWRAA